MSPDPYKDLNPAQVEAVAFGDGALLVSAAAGTGKTRVLTRRIARLTSDGVASPPEIMALTFTNRAAFEMRSRVQKLLGARLKSDWMGTFHALGLRILRFDGAAHGHPGDFTILDEADRLRLAKEVIKDRGFDPVYTPPAVLCAMIEGWKSRAFYPRKVPRAEVEQSYAKGKAVNLYEDYQNRLRRSNSVDFSDLLLESFTMLKTNERLLQKYRSRFRYMMVDEYQDTNTLQFMWLRLLAGSNGNITAVGDDDQCIYSWRGAEINNFLGFAEHFPGAKIIRLEQNYRSTNNILKVASQLVSANSLRLKKTLWSELGDGEKVRLYHFLNDKTEAMFVCSRIRQMIAAGSSADKMAILLRASALTRRFEEYFRAAGIPYKVVGTTGFYAKMEVRDALAWLRFADNPQDEFSLRRALERPKRGVGAATLSKAAALAAERGLSLFAALEQLAKVGSAKVKAAVADLKRVIACRNAAESQNSAFAVAEAVINRSGYTEHWNRVESPDAASRLENVRTLLEQSKEAATLSDFLEQVALVSEEEEQGEEYVRIMTIHAAKGLEFDLVFLCGWDEGILPHLRSLEQGVKGLEEERRLAHVALTRAKREAIITRADSRFLWGDVKYFSPSRFIAELPAAALQIADMRHGARPEGFGEPIRSFSPGGFSSPRGFSRFEAGQRVAHPTFGYGTVAEVQHQTLVINFADKQRVIEQSYVKVIG